jgi:hypothetical protein
VQRDAQQDLSMIRVGDDGPEYGQTISQKKALLEGASPDETILWPWAGQWSTTVFALTVEQARALVADPRHTLPSHRLLFPENII